MNNEYIRKHDVLVALMDNDIDHIQAPNGKEAVQILSDIPAADVVPVVRCKDCKHCYFADNRVPDEQGWVCEINSSEPVNLNGFCSCGEKKGVKL